MSRPFLGERRSDDDIVVPVQVCVASSRHRISQLSSGHIAYDDNVGIAGARREIPDILYTEDDVRGPCIESALVALGRAYHQIIYAVTVHVPGSGHGVAEPLTGRSGDLYVWPRFRVVSEEDQHLPGTRSSCGITRCSDYEVANAVMVDVHEGDASTGHRIFSPSNHGHNGIVSRIVRLCSVRSCRQQHCSDHAHHHYRGDNRTLRLPPIEEYYTHCQIPAAK